MTHSNERLKYVDGIYFGMNQKVFFFYWKPNTSGTDFRAFFYVFDSKFWLATFLSIFVSSILLSVLSNNSVAASFTVVLRSYAMIGYDIPLTTKRGRRSIPLNTCLLTISLGKDSQSSRAKRIYTMCIFKSTYRWSSDFLDLQWLFG